MNILLRRDYRMVVLSDEHCGHISGLTHPDYQGKFINDEISKHDKLTRNQKEHWNFFETSIRNLQKEKKIDILVNNGDMIDGDGWRSGGTELLTTDRNLQIKMAQKVVETVNASNNVIIAGTGYHTGDKEDWEETLASRLNDGKYKCKFENHSWLDINKRVFDIKHHCGSSGVPHGRYTAIAKESIWAKLWGEAELIPKPVHYLIRSHVHYFSMIDDGNIIAMTTPALQGFGSKFGARRCSGIPSVGFISFDIKANGTVLMRKHMADLTSQKAKAIVFN